MGGTIGQSLGWQPGFGAGDGDAVTAKWDGEV